MSTPINPVQVAVKDDRDRVVRECTLHISDSSPSDSHTFSNLPAGKYKVEYTPPDGLELTSNALSHHTLLGDRNELQVKITLIKATSDEPPASPSSSSSTPFLSPLEKILGLTAISLVLLGSLRLPIDFFPKFSSPQSPPTPSTHSISKSSQKNSGEHSKSTPELSTSTVKKSFKISSPSTSNNQLRKCLITNIRDVADIPTLTDLAKNASLGKVADEQIRKEVMELYDKVDRLRQILHGCDPKLASEVIAAKDREMSQNQLYSEARWSEGRGSGASSSITISTCHGIPSDAYFRSVPTLAEWAIQGVVEHGQQGYLTGRTYSADGVVWHEAFMRQVTTNHNKQTRSNQIGWIADCFVH